jgi:hypothetical protein
MIGGVGAHQPAVSDAVDIEVLNLYKYYVHTSLGNDGTGEGSFTKPWRTCQFAANYIRTNAITDACIHVFAGEYNDDGFDSEGNAVPYSLWIAGAWFFEPGVVLFCPSHLFDNTGFGGDCVVAGALVAILGGAFLKHVNDSALTVLSIKSVSSTDSLFQLTGTVRGAVHRIYSGIWTTTGFAVIDAQGNGSRIFVRNAELVFSGGFIYSRDLIDGSEFYIECNDITGPSDGSASAVIDIDQQLRVCLLEKNRILVNNQDVLKIGDAFALTQFNAASFRGASVMFLQNEFFTFNVLATVVRFINCLLSAGTFYYYLDKVNAQYTFSTTDGALLFNYCNINKSISQRTNSLIINAGTSSDVLNFACWGTRSFIPQDFLQGGNNFEIYCSGNELGAVTLGIDLKFSNPDGSDTTSYLATSYSIADAFCIKIRMRVIGSDLAITLEYVNGGLSNLEIAVVPIVSARCKPILTLSPLGGSVQIIDSEVKRGESELFV